METTSETARIIWNDVRNLISETYDPAILPWLDKLTPRSFENSVMTVSTRQEWALVRVTTDYKQLIESLLSTITLEKVILNIEVDNSPRDYATSEFAVVTPSNQTADITLVPQIIAEEKPQEFVVSSQMNEQQVPAPITREMFTNRSQAPSQLRETQEGLPLRNERTSEFTFENYVVGEANNLAFEYARDVAEQPSGTINPLFIYGPSGYGKTHLLYAIINYVDTHQHGAYKVLYVSANTFVEQFVEEIRVKHVHGESVMKQYRDVDILLVDDVQQFNNKQQESLGMFFDLFNKLVLQGKQIVLAADRAPDYLNLDERMKSRFGQGLVVDIKAPTYEMKRSILKNLYLRSPFKDHLRIEIPDDIFDVIAQIGPDNPRSMQGFITSLIAEVAQNPSVLTLDGIKEFNEKMHKTSSKVGLELIARRVAEHYGVTIDDLRAKTRTKNVSEARQVVMWMTRQLTDYTHEEIGKFLGDRDHATVSYGVKETEKRCTDRGYATMLNQLKMSITE